MSQGDSDAVQDVISKRSAQTGVQVCKTSLSSLSSLSLKIRLGAVLVNSVCCCLPFAVHPCCLLSGRYRGCTASSTARQFCGVLFVN